MAEATPGALRLADRFAERLRCPACRESALDREAAGFVCANSACKTVFPIVDGAAVLIAEERSLFDHSDFTSRAVTTMDLRSAEERRDSFLTRLKRGLVGLVPSKSLSVTDFSAADALAAIESERPDPDVLVVGAGDAGYKGGAAANIVYSDVALGGLTQIIADAHDIPFAEQTFDAVVCVAVLEHVADPGRVVSEIARVLKPGGFVVAFTPFMQQVHMGRYDFTRFTALGHRRLFRDFGELKSGIANGPGMALAWSFEYFLSSFSETPKIRGALKILARVTTFWLKYFDRILARKAGAYDGASAFYFFGRLRDEPVSDREIVQGYRGLNS